MSFFTSDYDYNHDFNDYNYNYKDYDHNYDYDYENCDHYNYDPDDHYHDGYEYDNNNNNNQNKNDNNDNDNSSTVSKRSCGSEVCDYFKKVEWKKERKTAKYKIQNCNYKVFSCGSRGTIWPLWWHLESAH